MNDSGFRVVNAADLGPIPPRPRRRVQRIAIAGNPVKRRGDPLGAVWWQGAQWAVTADGLECRDGTYFIDRNRLFENPEYPWPRHMAGKLWVDIDEFTTAWMVALLLHAHGSKIAPKALLEMFATLPPVREGSRPQK